jgi:hydroxyacylglutathione hydrolase
VKMPPAHQVDRGLVEGDEVAGFEVLDVPGHSPGHIALWRESDRVLVCGDVFMRLPRVAAPFGFLTVDVDQNRESMRRLASLRPSLVLFGHGRPLRDPDRLAKVAG